MTNERDLKFDGVDGFENASKLYDSPHIAYHISFYPCTRSTGCEKNYMELNKESEIKSIIDYRRNEIECGVVSQVVFPPPIFFDKSPAQSHYSFGSRGKLMDFSFIGQYVIDVFRK